MSNRLPTSKSEAKGVLNTLGKNPSLDDISAGDWPSTVLCTDQCNLLLFHGKNDKWLALAKELNGKPAVVRGELLQVGRKAPKSEIRPFGIVPLPFVLLDVADLQVAPAQGQPPK